VFLSHPDVAAAAAIGVPDRIMGEEIKVVIVRRSGSSITAAELRDHAARRIAAFMLPRFIEFVAELPYTDVGKLKRDRLALRSGQEWDARDS
jgi:acyl-coenzyme A synthetase/AMP-(fatty) acid ligase